MRGKAALGVAIVLAAGWPAAGDELWRQNPIIAPGGFSSQDARNTGGYGWFSETADNFTAATRWTITDVAFWGGYAAYQPGSIHGATIRFYSDSAGVPGARIFQRDITAVNETLYAQPEGMGEYHYDCALSPGFTLPAPGTYWVSVVALVDRGGTATDPQWGWVEATPATSHTPFAEQWYFTPGMFTAQDGDVSFVLSGTASGGACYANCDGSTGAPALNVADFTCFLQKFATGDPYANCDGSTGTPVLNVQDFTCFLQSFAQGCP
jgi:hypothetical protein